MSEEKDLAQLKKEAVAKAKAEALAKMKAKQEGQVATETRSEPAKVEATPASVKAEEAQTAASPAAAGGDDEKAKAIAAAKAKAAAAAAAKAAALAKAQGGESAPAAAGGDDEKAKAIAAAKAKAAAAAKAKLAAQGGESAPASAGGDDEKAKAIAAAKAKAAAAAAAKAKTAASGDSAEPKAEAEPVKKSPNQPYLDKYVKVIGEHLGTDVLEDSYINNLSKDVPTLVVKKDTYFKVAEFLKYNEQLGFDYLSELHASDFETHMEMYVHLFSYKNRQSVALKVKLDRNQPVIQSLVPLWEGANWPECEAFDLFGVQVEGHPDLHRILLGEEWIGHPLRKDYVQYDEEV